MVSAKMHELGTKKSTIRSVFEYGQKRIKEVGADKVYDFSLGNPNVPTPEFVKEAILDIVANMDPVKVHSYTMAPGNPEVRELLAQDLNNRFATNFTGKNLFITSGAAAAISIAFKALAEPGDEFVTMAPYFPEYKCFVEATGASLKVVPAKIDDFQIDFPALEGMICEKTKAIIVNSPNNPAGTVYSENTIKQLAALLKEKEKQYHHPIYLISDEPYREIVYDGLTVPYLTKYYDNTIVCYSYSKSFSLAGERIGYIVVPDEMDDFPRVFGAIAGAARVLTHVNASSLFQLVIGKCVGQAADLSIYEENGKILYEGLIAAGFKCVKPQGAFYLFPQSLEEDDYAFCKKAMEYDLLLVPGSDFGCPGHFRASYCIKQSTIKNSLPVFKELAKYYGK